MKTTLLQLFMACYACFSALLCTSQNDSTASSVCNKMLCTCENDPSPAGLMITHAHQKSEWMLSYRYMGMRSSDLLSGQKSLPANDIRSLYSAIPKTMQMNMHMLMGMYGLTERLTIMGMVMFNQMNMQMSMQYGTETHHHYMKTQGMGDSKVYVMYAPVKTETWECLVFSGVSLPTGSIRKNGPFNSMMYPNARYPYAMQNGSGSFEALPGINIRHQQNDLTLCWQSSATIRLNSNAIEYRLGNEYSTNAWAAWQWSSQLSNSVRFEGAYSSGLLGGDASLQPSLEPQANALNYGGSRVSSFAGLNVHFKKQKFEKHLFSAEFGIPLYQKVKGVQLKTKSTVFINWTFII